MDLTYKKKKKPSKPRKPKPKERLHTYYSGYLDDTNTLLYFRGKDTPQSKEEAIAKLKRPGIRDFGIWCTSPRQNRILKLIYYPNLKKIEEVK